MIFVQHDGVPGDDFAPFTAGWPILASIERDGAERVLVAGWATDFWVDATVRSAAALGFEVVVVADAHTASDRPHLGAERVIEHHQWVWDNLLAKHAVCHFPRS